MPIRDTQVPLISFDLESLRRDARELVSQYPNLSDWDIESFNDPLAITLNHYLLSIERLARWANAIAQDFSLVSAKTYDAVVAHATSIGYDPIGNSNASGKMNLTFSGGVTLNLDPYDIEVSTIGNDGEKVYYTNTDPIFLTPSVTSVTNVDFVEGRLREVIKTSNGLAFQTLYIQGNVVKNSVSVKVNGEKWKQVFNLAISSPDAKEFMLRQLSLDNYLIVFGDNVHGRIPPVNTDIVVSYILGGGTRGNVTKDNVNFTVEKSPTLAGLLTVTNGTNDFTGGTDPETMDHIKVFAPLTVKTQDRLVSLSDIRTFCESYTGVARARAFPSVGVNANVYIIPTGGGVASQTLINNLRNDINARLVIGHFSNVYSANYFPVSLNLTITILPNYNPSEVKSDVVNSILRMLDPLTKNEFGDYINDFGSPLRLMDVVNKVRENKAVISVVVSFPVADPNGILYSIRQDQILTDVGSTVNVEVLQATDAELGQVSNSDLAVTLSRYMVTDPRNTL
jgi:hypothetical protein